MKPPVVGCHACPAQRAYIADAHHLDAPLIEFLGALAPGKPGPWSRHLGAWSLITGDGPPRVYCPNHTPLPVLLAAA